MYQYRQSGNNKLENLGKLLVVIGCILGIIAFVLVLTRGDSSSPSSPFDEDDSCATPPTKSLPDCF